MDRSAVQYGSVIFTALETKQIWWVALMMRLEPKLNFNGVWTLPVLFARMDPRQMVMFEILPIYWFFYGFCNSVLVQLSMRADASFFFSKRRISFCKSRDLCLPLYLNFKPGYTVELLITSHLSPLVCLVAFLVFYFLAIFSFRFFGNMSFRFGSFSKLLELRQIHVHETNS